MEEIWKDVPGYEGYYQISNLGNIRRLAYVSARGRRIKAGPVAQCYEKDGYKVAGLCLGNSNKQFRVHRLVLMAFVGPRPEGLVIDHLNGKRDDNRLCNLEYVTPRTNSVRSFNTRGKSSGAPLGVCPLPSGRFRARARINNVPNKNLGVFNTPEEAHQAYLKAIDGYPST